MAVGKLLVEGEEVVLSLRTHAKALVLPAVVLIVLAGIAGYLTAVVGGGDVQRWVVIGIWAVAAVAAVVWTVIPFLRWRTSEYTVTTRRVLVTSGLVTRVGRAIPLHRINDVQFERGPLDRLLGCGSLIVSEASEQGGMRLHDVPQIANAHRVLTGLVFARPDDRP